MRPGFKCGGEGQERKPPELLGQLWKGLVPGEKSGQLIKLLEDDEIFSLTVGIEVNRSEYTVCVCTVLMHVCFTHSH